MTFEDFITKFPEVNKTGKRNMVRCPAHEDNNASMSIAKGRDGIVVHCFAGCTVKEICEALGIKVRDLFFDAPKVDFKVKYKVPVKEKAEKVKGEIEKIYSYTNALGREVFQVVRYKPKDFRQRHKDQDGEWKWDMKGVERVMYNLPNVINSKNVVITAGEKDADNLIKEGYVATTNVGGEKNWLDAYADTFVGKDVIICGDNDETGREYVQEVFDSISGKAKTVKVVNLPENIKDVSDFIAEHNGDSKKLIDELIQYAVPHYAGIKLPLYRMSDFEPRYKRLVKESSGMRLDLGAWLPTLRRVRPLFPGDFALLVADTAVGKTALIQNIAFRAKHLKSVLFELELPEEMLYERFLAIHNGLKCSEIEDNYRNSDDELGKELLDKVFGNILICPEMRLTPERMEQIILRSELVMGEKPQLVLVDYVQLMNGKGSTKTERASDIGDSLKVIARITKTIVVGVSQVARPSGENNRGIFIPNLHSPKDSGSFENSAQLVVGVWRDENDPMLMNLRVLKSTKGGAGTQVACNFDGETMRINERSKVHTDE